ncbi:uncharacterized protein LODBEIA_P56270 [Lodderomyces beijingensis]|uniref:Lysophospholipase n=1 Tax=Lodderomyces beijingensis TaxID=1775926 RepID=A0ABP0ZUT3_9ASCO
MKLITILIVLAYWITHSVSEIKFLNNATELIDSFLLENFHTYAATGVQYNLSYAPYEVVCPNYPVIRAADNTLCTKETEYITKRNIKTEANLKSILYKNKIPQFDVEQFWSRYKQRKSTKIALAFSGGGYRSMLAGAGVLMALDDRELDKQAFVNGILQSSSYIAGISGGSWLVMSQFINDFPRVSAMINGSFGASGCGWDVAESLLEGMPDVDPRKEREANIELEKVEDGMGENAGGGRNSGGGAKAKDGICRKEGFFDKVFNILSPGMGMMTMMTTTTTTTMQNKSKVCVAAGNDPVRDWFIGLLDDGDISKKANGSSLSLNESLISKCLKFYKDLLVEVRDKKKAGFHTSLTDYWGRALARRIFTPAARTPGITMTAASKNLASFLNHDQPLPIIGTIERDPSALEKGPTAEDSSLYSHVMEFTPFEFGSWDGYLNAFVDLEYLGSHLANGHPMVKKGNLSSCVSGFDNVGFLTGTSSSLFNHVFRYVYALLDKYQSGSMVAVEEILKVFGFSSEWNDLRLPKLHPDYALYSPNPFFNYSNGVAGDDGKRADMYLVDGGDDGQNIPFQPLLASARQIDIILAYDMSGEFKNYPNGTVLQKAAMRFGQRGVDSGLQIPCFRPPHSRGMKMGEELRSIFPKVPSQSEVMEQGLSVKPIFLGCDVLEDFDTLKFEKTAASAAPHVYQDGYLPPLIMYMAHSNYSHQTNMSTFKLSYNETELNQMVENGFQMGSYYNSSLFATCLNCMILKREFDRVSHYPAKIDPQHHHRHPRFKVPKTCQICYKTFCWRSENSLRN